MKFCLRNFIIGKFRNLSIYDLIYKIVWNGRRDSRELRNSPQSGLARDLNQLNTSVGIELQ